jgi:hypothetical protein
MVSGKIILTAIYWRISTLMVSPVVPPFRNRVGATRSIAPYEATPDRGIDAVDWLQAVSRREKPISADARVENLNF